VDGSTSDHGFEPLEQRWSPVKFFHGVLFVLSGGLVLFWTPWGLALIGVGAVIGFVGLKMKASTLDIAAEQRRLGELRDDVTRLLDSAQHGDVGIEQQLRTLDLLRQLGHLSPEDYEARRAEITGSGTGSTPP
jgi:hypothetical protein